jgi:hypothetical protein
MYYAQSRTLMPPLARGGRSLLVTIGDRPGGTGGFLNRCQCILPSSF